MKIIETCPICGHDLVDLILTYNPPISKRKCFNCGFNDYINTDATMPKCFNCGLNDYINTDATMPEVTLNGGVDYYIVERCVPVQPSDSAFENSACKYCSNNPRNGGSGICHCIMGSPEIR